MDEKDDRIAKFVWDMAHLAPDETIDGYTMEEFRDKVQKILND